MLNNMKKTRLTNDELKQFFKEKYPYKIWDIGCEQIVDGIFVVVFKTDKFSTEFFPSILGLEYNCRVYPLPLGDCAACLQVFYNIFQL